MRMTVAIILKTTLPKINSSKEFMKFEQTRSQTIDESLASTLTSTLTTMTYDGVRTMREHVLEMTTLAKKIKDDESKRG